MNIILCEERPSGQAAAEQAFNKALILIGRDASECDIAFGGEQYPMVSRRHAELRWHEERWILIDQNSSYGTYLNGRPVAAPTPIATGNRIQFGVDGPIIRVVWFEVSADPAPVATPQLAKPVAAIPPQIPAIIPNAAPPARSLPPAALELSGVSAEPRKISKSETWLGREPGCDIVFDTTSATVSRKHASIKATSSDYLLVDNNSFNGTLLNEQRVSGEVPLYDGDTIRLGLGGPAITFRCPDRKTPAGAELTAQRSAASVQIPGGLNSPKTVVLKLDRTPSAAPRSVSEQPHC